jgi:hypothetical protein
MNRIKKASPSEKKWCQEELTPEKWLTILPCLIRHIKRVTSPSLAADILRKIIRLILMGQIRIVMPIFCNI